MTLLVYLLIWKKLEFLADAHNLWIIEDACHAPGGYFIDSKSEKNFCEMGIIQILEFFFSPGKAHIACGEGGMLTTNSKVNYTKN